MINYIKYITLSILTYFFGIKILILQYAFNTYNRSMSSFIKLIFLIFLISWQFVGIWISLYGLFIFGIYEFIYRWKLIKEIIKIILSIDKLNIEKKDTLYITKCYNFVKKYTTIAYNKTSDNIIYQKSAQMIGFVYNLKNSLIIRHIYIITNKINVYISLILNFVNKCIKKIPYTDEYLYHELKIINKKYQDINIIFGNYGIGINQVTKGIKNIQSMMDKLDKMEGLPSFKKINNKVLKNDSFNNIFNSIMDFDFNNIFGTENENNNNTDNNNNNFSFDIKSMVKTFKKSSNKKMKKH